MISLRKTYHTRIVHLPALFLTLLFSLVSLGSCNQPEPLYTSLNLGIPAAALQSPVKGTLPDTTKLNVGITFKIDPRLLNQTDQQRLGIDNGLYQKIQGFFQGIDLKLSKLRTYVSFRAKAGTLARLLQTKFVIHLYKGRTFYVPATPPKVPSDFAGTIDAITGLDNYSIHPRHALHFTPTQGSHVSQHGAPDCSPDDQMLATDDVAGAYGYNTLWQRGVHGENMTINLVETDGSYQDDIQNYLSCVHLEAFEKGISSMRATVIVQATIQAWEEKDANALASYLSDDVICKQILPQPIDKAQLLAFMKAITTAFPDWSFNGHVLHEESLEEHSGSVLFVTGVTGTQTGDLILPTLPVIPATGTKIALPYRHLEYLVTDDTITAITADFSPNGLEEVLAQLGLKLP